MSQAVSQSPFGSYSLELSRLAEAREVAEVELTAHTFKWLKSFEWAEENARSPLTWLAVQLHIPRFQAKRLLNRAQALESMPLVAAAYFDREINACHVDRLVDVRTNKIAHIFERDEEMLVGFAKKFARFAEFGLVVEEWRQHALDEISDSPNEKEKENRRLHLSQTFEGNWRIDGDLPNLSGGIVNGELRRIAQELFEEDWAEAKAELGENITKWALKRDDEKRMADALEIMAMRSSGADGVRGRILVNVVMGNESFAKMCRTAEGKVISPDAIVPYLDLVDIERMVTDPASKLIDLGRRRSFEEGLGRFIRFRDQFCTDESGCDVPAHLCEIDHDEAWTSGGQTNDTNGRTMCGCHNRRKGAGPPRGNGPFDKDPPPAA